MDSPTVYCPNGCLEFGLKPGPMKLRYGTWEPGGIREASCSRCGFEAPWVPVLETDLTALNALNARVAELEAELPDDYSESKDWKCGNAVSRIQWLKAMMESYRFEVERLETQLLGNPE